MTAQTMTIPCKLVTADGWSVSTETCRSLFEGAKLRARRFDRETFEVVECLDVDGVVFADGDEARWAALDGGALKVYVPRWEHSGVAVRS